MRLTVLGSSASYAGAGQACSGHLVQGGGASVLFDCGNGVLANLQRVADPLALDAVFVTHYHPDHFVDLFAFQALLRYAPGGPAGPVPLYLPAGLFERLKHLQSDRGVEELEAAFVVNVLHEGVAIRFADLKVTPVRVDHTEPTFALRAEADGAVIAYTADSAATDRLVEAMRGADLAVAEATLPERYAGAAPHLTAGQAGRAAREAGAGALVLAHIWPTNDRAETAREAAEAFGAPVMVASEFDVFEAGREEGSS